MVLDPYRVSVLLLLFSIGLGIHALSHLGLEKGYGFVWWGRREQREQPKQSEAFLNGVGGITCPCQRFGICPGRGSGCRCLGFVGRTCPYCAARI